MILSGFSFFIQKGMVKGIINFQHRKVFKLFLNAFYWKDFFFKGFFTDFMRSVGDAVIITAGRINLTDPSRILITCGSYENCVIKASEWKIFPAYIMWVLMSWFGYLIP